MAECIGRADTGEAKDTQELNVKEEMFRGGISRKGLEVPTTTSSKGMAADPSPS